jgi:non-ribosomal peptide synthetase component F
MSLPVSTGTSALSPSGANIARYLPAMAAAYPDRVAVLSDAVVGERLSFAELNRESDRLAWGLRGCGIGRGTRVLLMVPAGPAADQPHLCADEGRLCADPDRSGDGLA